MPLSGLLQGEYKANKEDERTMMSEGPFLTRAIFSYMLDRQSCATGLNAIHRCHPVLKNVPRMKYTSY